MRMLCLVFLLHAVAFAATQDDLVKNLESDDFDEREAAMVKLSDYPGECASKFLEMAAKTEKLETRFRLVMAAKEIYRRRILTADERYLRLVAERGFEYTRYYTEYDQSGCDGNWMPSRESKFLGMHVDCMWPLVAIDGKLRRHDIIVEIDGKPMAEIVDDRMYDYGLLAAGRTYKYKVRRYKNIKEIDERGCLLPNGDPYEVIEVEQKVAAKQPEDIRMFEVESIEKLSSEGWAAFRIFCEMGFSAPSLLEKPRPPDSPAPRP